MTVDAFLALLDGVKRSGDGWGARCPAHDDRHASLSVAVGAEGRVLLNCHAGDGCTLRRLAALGIGRRPVRRLAWHSADRRDLRLPRRAGRVALPGRPLRAEGVRAAASRRTRRLDLEARGRPAASSTGCPRCIAAVEAGEPVYVVEGEKDVQALGAAGLVATATRWAPASGGPSTRRRSAAPSRRRPGPRRGGREHAATVAVSLEGVAASVALVEPAAGKDAGAA